MKIEMPLFSHNSCVKLDLFCITKQLSRQPTLKVWLPSINFGIGTTCDIF